MFSHQNVADVVGKKALSVEHGGNHLGRGAGAHGLVVGVLVDVHPGLHQLGQGQHVAPAPGGPQHGLLGEGEQLGLVPGQDAVARSRGQPGVGGDDGKVLAGHGHYRAVILLIRREPVLDRAGPGGVVRVGGAGGHGGGMEAQHASNFGVICKKSRKFDKAADDDERNLL